MGPEESAVDFNQALMKARTFLGTSAGKAALVATAFVLLTAGALVATLSGKHSPTGTTATGPTPSASASGSASPTASASPSAGASASPLAIGPGGTVVGPGGTIIGYGGKPIPPDVGPHRTATGFTYTPASLYSGASNYQGITSTTITICMHAAISLGPAFNETANDVLTYWNYVNAHGGVIGRHVNVTIEDDKYTAQGAQVAAQQCQGLNPMFVMGGIGFDQDPVVRTLAEQNHFLYLYTMADDGSQGSGPRKSYQYSYTSAPTIEQVGNWMGQVAVHQNQGPYGAVYVNDGNWVGGYNTYRAYLESHGVNKQAFEQQSYTMGAGGDASQFSTYVTKLKLAGVKTVYLWMNALGAGSFVQTAKSQGYFPAYVTPDAFDLFAGEAGESMDTGSSAVKPALAGWITPAFDPKYQNVPYWGAEKEMLDAYQAYDGGHTPDDIDWQAWLGFKSITDMLTQCGVNCSRNDIAGMFNSGWSENMSPLCPTSFAANHNFGGQFMNLYEATRVPYVSPDYAQLSQHTVWRQVSTCSNKFN
jgi:ABC-type branched-subunit amino acid transport system substrate-binding protein